MLFLRLFSTSKVLLQHDKLLSVRRAADARAGSLWLPTEWRGIKNGAGGRGEKPEGAGQGETGLG